MCTGAKIPSDAVVWVLLLFLHLFVSQFPVTLLCCAPEQVFPPLGHLQLSQGICECIKERGGKKKQHTYKLQRSAMKKKYLKPFCFAMTMMNEILLM